MKLVKTASGKQTIKISKSEWTSIGKKAGWMKVAGEYKTPSQMSKELANIPPIDRTLELESIPSWNRIEELWENPNQYREPVDSILEKYGWIEAYESFQDIVALTSEAIDLMSEFM